MPTLTIGSLFQECDFCRRKGEVGKTLVPKGRGYFCPACVSEIEKKQKDYWDKYFKDNHTPTSNYFQFR